jgi:hypothetical protein
MKAFFLPLDRGRRLCLLHAGDHTTRLAILFIHPFAEEMNKVASQAADALVARLGGIADRSFLVAATAKGSSVKRIGRSGVSDVLEAAAWLRKEAGIAVAMGNPNGVCSRYKRYGKSNLRPKLLLWQPIIDGRHFLHSSFSVSNLPAIACPERRVGPTDGIAGACAPA